MGILLDIGVYSALRTRGNLKVAYETQLMRELGTSGYVEMKQRVRSEKRKRSRKICLYLLLIAITPVLQVSIPIWTFIGCRWLWRTMNG